MPSSMDRVRRHSRHPHSNARRLFSRSQSNSLIPSLPPPTPSTPSLSPPSRRSFLAKPPTPGAAKRVLAVLREQKKPGALSTRQLPYVKPHHHGGGACGKGGGSDEACVSARSSSVESDVVAAAKVGKRGRLPDGPLDVDVSEVSDEGEKRLRKRQGTLSNTPDVKEDLLFIDDVGDGPGYVFDIVGEGEDEVPEAPGLTAVGQEEEGEVVRLLRDELACVRGENGRLEGLLKAKEVEYDEEVKALKMSVRDKEAEVEDLARQLKDVRWRLQKRIKEVEDEAEVERASHAKEVERRRGIEERLRSELERWRGGRGFVRTESSPTLEGRRKKREEEYDKARGGSSGAESVSSGSGTGPHPNFARVRSAGNVHENVRRTTSRPELHAVGGRPGHGRRSSSASNDAAMVRKRMVAKRSLLRRSFVAHIHSSRYRSMRAAWNDFLGGDKGHVTPERFARAVRGLAIAVDAKERDLEMLRREVCGAEEHDTGVVTWAMFVRFYKLTEHEST
eukprot:GFKZ01005661.1.p1 GENE.GFKZ01005661.1~~GFKZ01005661.1.p1  ORF type:complete len:506 (-),score=118.36 GFKZ01005661.1:2050-3567(-)